MPTIPYPEFNSFKLHLVSKTVTGESPVEGFAFLSMNGGENCVKDILIACRCVFRYRNDQGQIVNALLHEEVSRNATPFDDEGIPEGDYEFPFKFSLNSALPPSVTIVGGWDNSAHCKIWYEIRAYVMHAENATIERKHLRTSVKFQRLSRYTPSAEIAPHIHKRKTYSWNQIDLKAELDKDVYLHGESIWVKIHVRNELIRSVYAIKVFVRQTVTLFQKEHSQSFDYVSALGSVDVTQGLPIKRNCTFEQRVEVLPFINKTIIANSYNVYALFGNLDSKANIRVASSAKRTAQEGIEVSYAVCIRFSLHLANDINISIPFTLSDAVPDTKAPPTYQFINESATPAERKAAEAAREQQRNNAWIHPPEDKSGEEEEEEEGDLPSYDQTMNQKKVYKQLRASKIGFAKRVVMRQSVFFEGSTDRLHSASHDLNPENSLPATQIRNNRRNAGLSVPQNQLPTLTEHGSCTNLADDIISADFVRNRRISLNMAVVDAESSNIGSRDSGSSVSSAVSSQDVSDLLMPRAAQPSRRSRSFSDPPPPEEIISNNSNNSTVTCEPVDPLIQDFSQMDITDSQPGPSTPTNPQPTLLSTEDEGTLGLMVSTPHDVLSLASTNTAPSPVQSTNNAGGGVTVSVEDDDDAENLEING